MADKLVHFLECCLTIRNNHKIIIVFYLKIPILTASQKQTKEKQALLTVFMEHCYERGANSIAINAVLRSSYRMKYRKRRDEKTIVMKVEYDTFLIDIHG